MDSAESIIEDRQGNIKVIKFNKPRRKNAINEEMYVRVKNILCDAALDDSISVMVLTGSGDMFSSGNDFAITSSENFNAGRFSIILHDYIEAFITFPKLLVAIVNGPAIGIAATTLALCDLVFASENSYFYTPFTRLGIVAEGCSTFTFPRLIGERKAAKMLLYNHKMTAKEALDCGFVNYLYKPEKLQSEVWDKIVQISNLSHNSVYNTRKMLVMKETLKDALIKTNDREIEALREIWNTREKPGVNTRSKI